MIGLGTILNVGGIVIGGLLGRFCGRFLKERYQDSLNKACGVCVQLGCPALGKDADGHAVVDAASCIGCNQCVQSCAFGCIKSRED